MGLIGLENCCWWLIPISNTPVLLQIAAYCASKAAVLGLTGNVALDYATYRIHCEAIAPGCNGCAPGTDTQTCGQPIDTKRPTLNAAARLIAPDILGMMDALSPFGGMGEPDDIAHAPLFFASEDANWINGQCLAVHGGRT
ncbi:NAD(P)-binding protein [Penicillium canescens]|nr:NAD(P)-binding protein [Penicillium canescens]